MKYLLTILLIGFIALSFIGHKCEHKFVAVEQAVIKIEQPNLLQGAYYTIPRWPTGIQEGKELICARCGLVQKQVLDYGKPEYGPTLTGLLSGIDSCLPLNGGFLTIDTSGSVRSK